MNSISVVVATLFAVGPSSDPPDPPDPEITEAELARARAEDDRRERDERRKQDEEDDGAPSWSRGGDFEKLGWLQGSPGIGAISIKAPRNRYAWSLAIGGGRLLAFRSTLLGLGASLRLTVPGGTTATLDDGSGQSDSKLAIVGVRPAIDIRWGPDFGRVFAFVGMSHGLAIEIPEDADVLASYSPGWLLGFSILAWRGLFIGAEINAFLHDVRAGGLVAPEDVGKRSAGAIAFDLVLGWKFGK